MANKVYIRADGSLEKGLGHLVRCTALAHMISSDFEIAFVCNEIPEDIAAELESADCSLLKISGEEDFLSLLSRGDLVVLDVYNADVEYHKKIRGKGAALICIDDIHNQGFYADLIINHAPGVSASHYDAPAFTQFALGPDYVLLRPPFLNKPSSGQRSSDNTTVFICFGGADGKQLTRKTLELVAQEYSFEHINVVTGAAYEGLESLLAVASEYDNVSHYHAVDAEKMAELLRSSHLAIVPSSGILLEALALGVKTISGMYVDNQKRLFENYKSLNAFISAEDFSAKNLREAIDRSLVYHTNTRDVIDGRSGERILKRFLQLSLEQEVHLRKATKDDLDLTFTWASDPNLRAFSFNQNEILFAEHSAWFMSKVANPDSYYYIAELEQNAVGCIRFDIEKGEAKISYLVDKDYHQKGLGSLLIKKGIEAFCAEAPNFDGPIIGFVLPANVASCKIFERFGFEKMLEDNTIKYSIRCK